MNDSKTIGSLQVERFSGHIALGIDNFWSTLTPGQAQRLRDYLTEFLGDAPPSVADDKVEALIRSAREWAKTLPNTHRNLSQETIRLSQVIAAFDPPDPDTELVEKMAEWMANDWGAYSWDEVEPEAKERWRTRAKSLLNITRSQ